MALSGGPLRVLMRMCGITGGIWTETTLEISDVTLAQMTEVLAHRGPDDVGTYRSDLCDRNPHGITPGAALGFRRLSIIDLAAGQQPMTNEDRTIWVVFNGEIYNFAALRHRLEGRGHRFRTQSDTETIVHLYEDEGVNCFSHLNGMFAIAIWDMGRRQLVLARDRLGQKPLVYCRQPHRFLFASQLKSLLQVPAVSREVDASAIDHYLAYQYVPHPATIFQSIRKLPPGHRAIVKDDVLTIEPFWEPDFQTVRPMGRQVAVEELRESLTSSIQLRMRSDVPLGAFLSGGVDSSLVTAIMQQHSPAPVKTFSIGFPVKEYDETEFARQVAQHLGTDHQEFQGTPDGVKILPQLVWHFDEPFADSSAIPTWYVAKMTREHVTVALTGDGGDELFLGYPRYRAVQLASVLDSLAPIKHLLKLAWWQKLPGSSRQKSLLRQFKRFSEGLAAGPQRRYFDWISIFNERRRSDLYTRDFITSLPDSDPFHFFQSAWSRADRRDPLTAVALADLTTYLPGDLMTKVDTASMAHSLECRQPFLDHRVVELAAHMSSDLKYRRGRGKRILQDAFGDLLPREIWGRRKMGFGVPLDHWFRNELKEMTHDVLLDQTPRQRGLFRQDTVETLLNEHQQGTFDHAYRLWALLVLELWFREWVD